MSDNDLKQPHPHTVNHDEQQAEQSDLCIVCGIPRHSHDNQPNPNVEVPSFASNERPKQFCDHCGEWGCDCEFVDHEWINGSCKHCGEECDHMQGFSHCSECCDAGKRIAALESKLKLAEQELKVMRMERDELKLERDCLIATRHMTIARLGGTVEGAPTQWINFLQRVDELREIERRYQERRGRT